MKFLLAFILCWTMVLSAEEEDEGAKMVYHCDFNDDDRYNLMLSNIRYSVDYYNDNLMDYDIRVVANSECIRYLFKDKVKSKVKPLTSATKALKINIKAKALNYDIGFYVCGNTLDAFKINKKDLEPFVHIVPSGVVEVVKLQQKENFGYVKVR